MCHYYKYQSAIIASKCVFYRQEHKANGKHLKLSFGGLLECKDEINQYTRPLRVNEKMGPFVELSCLLPQLYLLKYQKWHFNVFPADNSKNWSKFEHNM